jgi:hypothetical protein
VLSTWLEKHNYLKKDGLSASQVQAIVDLSLRINMSEKDTEQRIIMLFADYRGILRNHALTWIVDENPKTAVNHIVAALKPSILKIRMKDDLTFGHIDLRKHFLYLCVTSSERPSTTRNMRSRQVHITNSGNQTRSPAQTPGLTKSPSSGSCRGSRTPVSNTANMQSSQPAGKCRAKNPSYCLNPSCFLNHYLR